MTTSRISLISCVMASLWLAGCAGDSASGGDSVTHPGAPGGGGGVGFGGAQDIGQFRGILAEGGIPGEGSLDANGFFAEHYAELPPAECDDVLCLHGMLAVGRDWVHDEYQAVLQVAMSTPIDPQTLERKPLNLVVVVDTSGSMIDDGRIAYAREGLHLLIDALGADDRMALVTYASNALVRASFEESADRAALHGLVDGLLPQGSTNLHDGLRAGFELAAAAYDQTRQNRVILLSDGLATVGVTDDLSIQTMADDYVRQGIGLTTIGVGREFNVALMRGLAERGAGNFYFLEDASAIQEVFVDELNYFITPLALNLELEIAPGAGYSLGEVVGARYSESNPEWVKVSLPAAFLASRVSDAPDPNGRRGGAGALFVRLDSLGHVTEPGAVASVRLRYVVPGSETVREQEITITSTLPPGETADDVYLSHEAMTERYAMYNLYLGLRQASQLAAYSYDCALAVLQRLDESAAAWQVRAEDPDIAADRELIGQFIENLSTQGAVQGTDVASCGQGGDYGPYPWYGDDEAHYHEPMMCSAGQGARPGAWVVLLLGLAFAVRRRR